MRKLQPVNNGLRSLNALFLSALIALTSVSMSLARGQMRDASGSIVLCTGTGPISVQVDSDGQPFGPMPICPDCVVGFMDYLAVDRPSPPPVCACCNIDFDRESAKWSGQSPIWLRARGPPFL